MELVCINSYSNPALAHLDKARLEEAGIMALVQDEFAGATGYGYNLIDGVKLMVDKKRLSEAETILA